MQHTLNDKDYYPSGQVIYVLYSNTSITSLLISKSPSRPMPLEQIIVAVVSNICCIHQGTEGSGVRVGIGDRPRSNLITARCEYQ